MNMRKLVAMEAAGWRSLARWLGRRPVVAPGATGFGYTGPTMPLMITFLVLSVVEVGVVDLIVHRWLWLRIPLLVLGIWGVTFMLGYLAGMKVHPHEVGPAGLTVRDGALVEHAYGWDEIEEVAPRRHTGGETAGVLTLAVSGETNVVARLRGHDVTEVRFYADDAAGLVAAARERVAR